MIVTGVRLEMGCVMKFYWGHLADLLFPFGRCLLCGKRTGAAGGIPVCPSCRKILTDSSYKRCPVCGIFYPAIREVCPSCAGKRLPHIRQVLAPAGYRGFYKRYILEMKYYRRRGYARPIGRFMAEAAKKEGWDKLCDAVTAVPLHPKKLRERGYNQAASLAREVADGLSLPYLPDIICRARYTEPQALQSRAKRLKNLSGAFAPGQNAVRAKELRILLIDDVITTGATAEQAARALKASGAAEIYVLCAASAKII